MSKIIMMLYELANKHGVMIEISIQPCLGSTIVNMQISKDYINENAYIQAQFTIDEGADDEEFEYIEETFLEMLEDA